MYIRSNISTVKEGDERNMAHIEMEYDAGTPGARETGDSEPRGAALAPVQGRFTVECGHLGTNSRPLIPT